MSTAAQKALESEFELDVRVSPVSSTPQIEAEYSNAGGGNSYWCTSSFTPITVITTLTILTHYEC